MDDIKAKLGKGRHMAENKRIEWVDIARGIAIILVVLGHSQVGRDLFNYLYSFHVPLFFFVAGITFRFDKESDFSSFVKKRFLRLLVPYYTFGMIAIAAFYLANKLGVGALDMFGYSPTLLQMFKSLLYGSGENHALYFYQALWFLPCMFSVCLISYGICKSALCFKEKNRNAVILCCAGLFVILTFAIRVFCSSLSLPLGLVQSFVHIPFFLLAVVLRSSELLCTNKRLSNALLAFILIFTGAFVSIGHNFCVAQFKLITIHAILIAYAVGVVSCLGYIKLCMAVHHSRVVSFVGQWTLPILVLHKYPIALGDILFPQFRHNSGNLYYCIPMTIFAVVISLLVGMLIDRYLPFLYGKPCRKQKKRVG